MTRATETTAKPQRPAWSRLGMIDVMIIAHNEALNLPHCLRALEGWTNKVFVIDSGSTDDTPRIATDFGAEFVHHDWPGYAQQKNWALDNLPFESDWILIVDADEVITPRLQQRLVEIASHPAEQVPENGFFINRLTYFLGRPIRHCGYFPNWNLRFFKHGKGRYEVREVHEHMIMEDPVGYVREPMLHDDRRGLEHYIAKHNRYSSLEAREVFARMTGDAAPAQDANIAVQSRHRRWLKRYVTPMLPFPGVWRFFYMYVLRLGILDGAAGVAFCRFISNYEWMVAFKLKQLRRQSRTRGGQAIAAAPVPESGLALTEGSDPVVTQELRPEAAPDPDQPLQMHPEASPWSFKEKLGRAVWMVFGRPLFRVSFHNWYGFRARLLRLFGARIGHGVAIRPSANIEVPWMIDIDDDATLGDHAILYSLGRIRIGKRSIISQYAHLCAGTHDYSDHTFRLLRTPITIGDDVWIGADAFIGPGVTVGSLSVVGARSSTYKDLPERQVFVGNPAKPIKERVLR
jgi:acetyltransferase-like isoleucine patch superfamily enzyme/glycosyltransferase involved in cell wall biosynthesis